MTDDEYQAYLQQHSPPVEHPVSITRLPYIEPTPDEEQHPFKVMKPVMDEMKNLTLLVQALNRIAATATDQEISILITQVKPHHWKKEELDKWGVPFPPQRGWVRMLRKKLGRSRSNRIPRGTYKKPVPVPVAPVAATPSDINKKKKNKKSVHQC